MLVRDSFVRGREVVVVIVVVLLVVVAISEPLVVVIIITITITTQPDSGGPCVSTRASHTTIATSSSSSSSSTETTPQGAAGPAGAREAPNAASKPTRSDVARSAIHGLGEGQKHVEEGEEGVHSPRDVIVRHPDDEGDEQSNDSRVVERERLHRAHDPLPRARDRRR